jgi:hypothetical protein
MTEQLNQRNLLKIEQKCDLNQLFRARMKLLNDSSVLIENGAKLESNTSYNGKSRPVSPILNVGFVICSNASKST